MAQNQTFSLSILLRPEQDGTWAAQCLEYDIAAQGKTLHEAKYAIEKAFVSQVIVDLSTGNAPLIDTPRAPDEYWKEFEGGERLAERKSFFIPLPFMFRAAVEEMRIAA
jgi:hypothetical protein